MTHILRTTLTAALMVVGLLVAQVSSAGEIYTGFFGNKAASGYDVVAFFTEGKPVEGSSSHSYKWHGAKWLFSSEKNRDAFIKDPEKYAPQYGGHCAWAVAAKDKLVEGSPKYWRIVDNKLYFNYDGSVQNMWEKDIPGFITKGNNNWVKH